MYIGPWQEFKLAKILQLKDKVDKEQQDSYTDQSNYNAPSAKAQSHYMLGQNTSVLPQVFNHRQQSEIGVPLSEHDSLSL